MYGILNFQKGNADWSGVDSFPHCHLDNSDLSIAESQRDFGILPLAYIKSLFCLCAIFLQQSSCSRKPTAFISKCDFMYTRSSASILNILKRFKKMDLIFVNDTW